MNIVENQLDETYVFSSSQSASSKPFLEVSRGQFQRIVVFEIEGWRNTIG